MNELKDGSRTAALLDRVPDEVRRQIQMRVAPTCRPCRWIWTAHQNLEAPASARIRADGSFDIAGLNGPRVFRLGEETSDWTLKAVRLNGREVTDAPLPFGMANQSIDAWK